MNMIKGLVSAAARLSSSTSSRLSNNAISSSNSSTLKFMNLAKYCHVGARKEKFDIQDKDLESEENIQNLYDRWMRYHGIFRSDEEKTWRLKLFADTAKYVHNHNKSGLHTFRAGATIFSDWTEEEKRQMCSRKPFKKIPVMRVKNQSSPPV